MATYGAAAYLRKDQALGSITRGKTADLVLLAGDPTTDISAVRHPQLVMKGSRVFFPDEIYLALGIRPFESHPSMSIAGVAARE
jgi:imidazolonepropionase-like amidohydrolase